MSVPLTVESYQFMEIIQEDISHSSDGIAYAAKLSLFMCTCVRSCVCMLLYYVCSCACAGVRKFV